jgi:hypothetical protein
VRPTLAISAVSSTRQCKCGGLSRRPRRIAFLTLARAPRTLGEERVSRTTHHFREALRNLKAHAITAGAFLRLCGVSTDVQADGGPTPASVPALVLALAITPAPERVTR